uniref:Uncharacterized protein n=1 Tax=Arundo donax TaxID=35708 RepID=A0A0A9GR76_ARUDO
MNFRAFSRKDGLQSGSTSANSAGRPTTELSSDCSAGASAGSATSVLNIGFCPAVFDTLGACARAFSNALLQSFRSSVVSAFRVKVRPSRPSGNNTVKSFLSSLTTTLPELFRSIPPSVTIGSAPLGGGTLGSLLKNTNDALVRINQRFFHDVQPIPLDESSKWPLLRTWQLGQLVGGLSPVSDVKFGSPSPHLQILN